MFMAPAPMEDSNGPLVDFRAGEASGTAERDAPLLDQAKERHSRLKTLGGDKHHDTRDIAVATRERTVTPRGRVPADVLLGLGPRRRRGSGPCRRRAPAGAAAESAPAAPSRRR